MSNQFTLSHPNNKMSIDEGISTNYKQIIIDSLDVLRKRDVADKAVFSARAYVKVITQLKNYNSPIMEYDDIKNINPVEILTSH